MTGKYFIGPAVYNNVWEQLQNTGPLLTMDQTRINPNLPLPLTITLTLTLPLPLTLTLALNLVGLGLILPTAEPNEPARLVHG